METDGINILIRENQFLREKLAAQKQRYADFQIAAIDLDQRININLHDIDISAKDRNFDGGSELQLLRDRQVIIKRGLKRLKKCCKLEKQQAEQAQGIDSLEKMLMQFINQQEEACETCADQDTEKCPGRIFAAEQFFMSAD